MEETEELHLLSDEMFAKLLEGVENKIHKISLVAKRSFQQQVSKRGYKQVGTYVKSKKGVQMLCPNGHKYITTPARFMNGSSCTSCPSARSERAKKAFQELVKESGYKQQSAYISAKDKVLLICQEGHEYRVKPADFKNGVRCSKCRGLNKEMAEEKFKNEINARGFELKGVYINSSTPVKVKCPAGHFNKMIPNNFVRGAACIDCSGKSSRVSEVRLQERADSLNYTIVGRYTGNLTKIEFLCNEGHTFFMTPKDFKSGNLCNRCAYTKRGIGLYKNRLDEEDTLYVVDMYCPQTKERFIKVGRSFNLYRRLKEHSTGDIYEVVLLLSWKNKHKTVYEKEQQIHDILTKLGYHLIPEKPFKGFLHECFSPDSYDVILGLYKELK